MFSKRVRNVVRKLGRLRLGYAGFVTTDRCKTGAGTEIKSWKCMCCGVLADVHTCQVKLIERIGALDRKINRGRCVRESEAELIDEILRDGVRVGS